MRRRDNIGAIERAERTPSIVQAERLARALGTTLAGMLAEVEWASQDDIMRACGDGHTVWGGKEATDAPADRRGVRRSPPLDGLRLHYAEQGDQEGQAIVFLHAYADSWFSYGRVLPLLSPSYHAFAPDQRGHGDSDKPQCCYTADYYAADVDAFMEAVGIDKATLVGDSSGGLIAQRVALRYPHRVSRLLLIGSPTTLVNNEAVMEWRELVRALEDPVPPEFVRELLASIIHHQVPEEFLERAISESLKVPARVWHDYWEGVVLTVDDTARYGEIGVPTLILWGSRTHSSHAKNKSGARRRFPTPPCGCT